MKTFLLIIINSNYNCWKHFQEQTNRSESSNFLQSSSFHTSLPSTHTSNTSNTGNFLNSQFGLLWESAFSLVAEPLLTNQWLRRLKIWNCNFTSCKFCEYFCFQSDAQIKRCRVAYSLVHCVSALDRRLLANSAIGFGLKLLRYLDNRNSSSGTRSGKSPVDRYWKK